MYILSKTMSYFKMLQIGWKETRNKRKGCNGSGTTGVILFLF